MIKEGTRRRGLAGLAVGLALGACGLGACRSNGPPSRPAACDDPNLAVRFQQCREAQDQVACEAAGGTWRLSPVDASYGYSCLCPTGQDGCACNAASQCVDRCLAPLVTSGLGEGACAGVVEGSCSADGSQRGCWCLFSDSPAAAYPSCWD